MLGFLKEDKEVILKVKEEKKNKFFPVKIGDKYVLFDYNCLSDDRWENYFFDAMLSDLTCHT